jgi:hypothetical protein
MIFSQKVSDLCVIKNITNNNIDEFMFCCNFSMDVLKKDLDKEVTSLLNGYNKKNIQGCIFIIPYILNSNYVGIYCSRLLEKELIKLINLKAFW